MRLLLPVPALKGAKEWQLRRECAFILRLENTTSRIHVGTSTPSHSSALHSSLAAELEYRFGMADGSLQIWAQAYVGFVQGTGNTIYLVPVPV